MFANALRVAGLVVAGWAVVRVVLLLSGNDDVVPAGDPHGYVAIFSLVLVPVLALAVGTLLADLRTRRARILPGVALVLSAPLASPVALVAVAVGLAIVATTALERRRSADRH